MIWFVNTVTQSKIKWFEWYAYFLGKNENTFSIKNGSCYKIVYFSSESLDLRKPNLRNNQVLRKWITVGMSYLESTLKKWWDVLWYAEKKCMRILKEVVPYILIPFCFSLH